MRLQIRYIDKVVAGLYEAGVLHYEKNTLVLDFDSKVEKAFIDGISVQEFIDQIKKSIENNKPKRPDTTQCIIDAFNKHKQSISTTKKTIIDVINKVENIDIGGWLVINVSTVDDLGDEIEFINIEGTEVLTIDDNGNEIGVCQFNKDEIISVIKENLGL